MGKKLGPGDSFFLQIESANTPMHVGVLCRFDLPKGKDKRFILDMVNAFRQHIPDQPPFNYVLANQGRVKKKVAPEWDIAKDIDIDYHLRHSALPQPGSERELAVLVSRLHSIHLDRARPMWECHIIEGLEGNRFAIYAKMHHALVDGVAGARMTERWFTEFGKGKTMTPYWAMPKPKRKPKPRPEDSNPFDTLIEQIMKPAKSVPGVIGAVTETLKGRKSKKLPGLVAPYSAPETVFNVPVGPQRRVSIADFELDRIRNLGKALGGTLNDVVMAVCGDALRRYLLELGDLPKEPLVAQVPVSFRPKEDDGGGNAIGMILASLGTDKEDTLARFQEAQRSMTAAKKMMKGMNTAQITAYSSLMVLPYAVGQISGIGNRRKKPMYNVVISNVPGPKQHLSFHDANLRSVHPVSLIMQGQALNITLFTYDDQFSFVYTACRRSLPSVQKLVGYTEEAIEALEKAAGIKYKAAPKAAAKSPAKKSAAKKSAARKTTAKKTAAKKPAARKQASKRPSR